MEEKIGKGLGWLDKALTMVDKYKFKTIFKGIFLIASLTISPYGDNSISCGRPMVAPTFFQK